MVLILAGILSTGEIRRQFDAGLLMVLACSLAVGVALEKSGAAELVANTIIGAGRWFGNAGLITCLFAATILLTSLITNPAAVAMMFPIALSMAQQSGLPPTPFFVAIAFAASGSFMTPFGYQTNLMVYGPGGYSFNDFLRAGGPLTLIYSLVCIVFILNYYGLVGG
jgi:di/tricarboxylate transporter